MKTPRNINQLSPYSDEYSLGPYPPLGFIPVGDAELGNGDCFGLYWPLGRESEEPVICDMYHDEWSMKLAFSSTDKFIEYLNLNGWHRGENENENEIDDDNFAPIYYRKAKLHLADNNVNEAIRYLELATESFPESCEQWFFLAGQLRRIGEHKKSVEASINAFVSNWIFGLPPQNTLRMLQSKSAKEFLPNDPIIKRAGELTQSFGGVKENINYPLLKEAVEEYLDQGENIKALSLYQNFAYMMHSETSSFHERYEFNMTCWQKEYSQLCGEKLGDCRRYDS
jgi:tetratricopeptide (TPR) repeat protein